jgi:Raf kinase inhibitor-like YbhB/YbcL family protein
MNHLRAISLAAIAVLGIAKAADAPFTFTSPDLPPGKPIADRFVANAWGCHGGNESPEFKWSNAPAGTKSFAITWFDPHTPPESGWWHWVVYDIPATATGLPRKAGDPGSPNMPNGAKQARPDNDVPEPQYYRPCPDEGDPPHRYTITLYALSVDHLDVPPTATPAYVEAAILESTLAKATIVRPFARPKKAQ